MTHNKRALVHRSLGPYLDNQSTPNSSFGQRVDVDLAAQKRLYFISSDIPALQVARLAPCDNN